MSAVIYQIGSHYRSKVVCEAMLRGLRAQGVKARIRNEQDYRGPEAEVAVFYGLVGNTPRIFEDYQRGPLRALYVDLGYYGRRQGGRWTGYHKVVVNSRHPTAYFQRRRHAADRISALNVFAKPWRTGEAILLAGMGDKGAQAEGYAPEQWERQALAEIRKHTDRPVIYRPKPSWKGARPIEGATYSPATQKIEELWPRVGAVVTHHSNVAVEALQRGIPAICFGGVAAPLASQDFAAIERLPQPEGRGQWLADIGYTQWSVAEMGAGLPWRHLREEGLL